MIQQAEIRTYKYKPMSEELEMIVNLSFDESIGMAERDLNCPRCKRYMATLFADSGGHIRLRCNNCKTPTVFNLGYFRTHRRRAANRMGYSRRTPRYMIR